MPGLAVRGRGLPDGEPVEWWIADGILHSEPVRGAGNMAHGLIATEVDALKGIGMSPTQALGAACWDARKWLGRSALAEGEPADLLCFTKDPRSGVAVLSRPDRVILRGRAF